MAELLFFLTLSCGGFCGAALLGKRFEEMLPITCCVAALAVFLFGLVGLLPVGPVFLLLAAFAGYAFSLFRLLRKKALAGFFSRLFTPGFVCFVLLYAMLLVLNRGVMFTGSDAFGHWGLVVKEMLRLGDFSTSPLSVDKFANYPPIMPVFQYFLQRLLFLFGGRTQISEWHVQFAYQIFSLSFLIPFMKHTGWRRPISAFFGFGVICSAPMVIFPYFYNTILIDSFLGVVFAYAMVMVLTERFSDKWDVLGIGAALSVLVLAKDSGISFALIVLLTLACMVYAGRKTIAVRWKLLLTILAFILLPKLLWKIHLVLRHCDLAHASSAGPGDYIRFLTLRDDSGYRYQALSLFLRLLYGTAYHFTLGNAEIPYIYILVAILFLNYLLQPVLKRGGILGQRASGLFCPVLNLHLILYTVGLLYVYLFRMPVHDAVGLSEMDRYFNTVLLSIWLVQLLLVMELFFRSEGAQKSLLCFLLTGLILLMVPISELLGLVGRSNVRASQDFRAPYEAVVSALHELAAPEDRIFTVSQTTGVENVADDQRIFIYSFLPNYSESYNLGDSEWSGDFQTDINCPELTRTLRADFDFFVLYRVNDYFMEHYSDAFENPEEIFPYSIYRVNPETGLLSLAARVD